MSFAGFVVTILLPIFFIAMLLTGIVIAYAMIAVKSEEDQRLKEERR